MSYLELEIGSDLRSALPGFKVQALHLQSEDRICLASKAFDRFLANAMNANCLDHATATCLMFCSDVKTLGWKVSRYRPSVAALLRQAKRSNFQLRRVLPVVDVGNMISLSTGLPVGVYDAKKIQGRVVINVQREEASMLTIGKGEMSIHNCVIAADKLGGFGSIVSDSPRTSITADTNECLLILYCGLQDCPIEWTTIARNCLQNIELYSPLYAE